MIGFLKRAYTPGENFIQYPNCLDKGSQIGSVDCQFSQKGALFWILSSN